jgi:hypothetical protein
VTLSFVRKLLILKIKHMANKQSIHKQFHCNWKPHYSNHLQFYCPARYR